MADEETDTDNDSESEEGTENSGGPMKKIILGVAAVALIGGGIFAYPAIMNMISPPPEEAAEGEEEEPESSRPALYTSLAPPLVVNVKDSLGETHFMQITMEVMARDQELLNSVREHSPVIRNNLILLYGMSTFEEVTTREGKEKLLADGLAEIKSIMLQRVGNDSIEALYFTSLIIQ